MINIFFSFRAMHRNPQTSQYGLVTYPSYTRRPCVLHMPYHSFSRSAVIARTHRDNKKIKNTLLHCINSYDDDSNNTRIESVAEPMEIYWSHYNNVYVALIDETRKKYTFDYLHVITNVLFVSPWNHLNTRTEQKKKKIKPFFPRHPSSKTLCDEIGLPQTYP
jgi:hypothetical protein